MEVSYKKTDVGIIPIDWDICTLSEFFDKGFQNGVFYEVGRKGKGVPIVNVSDLYGGIPIKEFSLEKFDATVDEISRFLVCKGDLFFTRSSIVPSGIAMCNVYDGETEHNVVFDSHVIKLSIDQHDINPLFLCLQCRMPNIRRFFIANSKTATMTTIDQKAMAGCPIPKPSLPEQERIVETLQFFDTYIDNLTELIEKKRNIRDGALEDLVSGRTRLDGFNDEWIEYSFDSFFTFMSNNTLSRDKLTNKGAVGNIHYGDVLIKYQNCLTNEDEIPYIKDGIDTKPFKQLQAGDVVIADTAEDETVGKAIQICDISIPVVGGLHTIVCRPNHSTALGYLGYYINSRCYHDQLYPHITGIKVSSISKKAIKTTFLKIPRDIDEQKEIVYIIVAMDEEIKEMEKQRDKIIQIREGAMDDLLTGRVRLKV